MTIEHAHVLEGHLEYSSMMPRPERWVKAEDYESLWNATRNSMGWMIEYQAPDGARWLTPKPMYDYTGFHFEKDPNAAIRFCRRQDAQAYFDMHRRDWVDHGAGVTITDHIWICSVPDGEADGK